MSSQDRLNIIHVIRQFHPGIGGMENYLEQLATRQAAEGHHVRVVTLNRIFDDPAHRVLPAHETWRGVEIVRVPFTGSRRYPVAPGVLKTLGGADIVHVHGVDFFVDYLAATRAVHRKPLVLTTHGGFFHTSFARGLKQVYLATVTRASLSQFAAVIACSAEDERLFKDVAGPRLTLIPNPVDIDKFEGLADFASDTIIYFGRLAPNKEVPALIDWFAGLAREEPAARLIVAGKPMGVDADALRAHAAELGLGDRFELHETPSDDEMKALIRRSGSYACASSYEGFGLAAVEAASAGLFPILSDIPPFADTLDRLGYGLLVDFGDAGSWSASYAEWRTAHTRFRSHFSADMVREAVSSFDWSTAVPRFEAIYREVLGDTSRLIGGVRVDVLDRDAAVRTILDGVERRAAMPITFCNAHTVNLARRDAKFRDLLRGFMVLNDGVGLDVASRTLFGEAFPENLNGTDFTPHLLGAAGRPLSVYLVGSKPGVAEDAAQVIAARYPHVAVVGTRDGFFRANEEHALLEDIRRSGADLVLAAMGQPVQEAWASRAAGQLSRPVLCVGALLDFLAERVPRAPERVRRLRLEWAYRLAQEPRRLASRYLVGNATFLGGVLKQKLIGTRI
ncbi:WecB/TagA/CpsF family glycosyltransferase [Sphingomonas sp. BN140010]|uniref:WecB/TagA/CpsF family glycosyltransferase n=1 Tax=Sphingomonas arvum TaxID=2992113 RepID=A0ABT3JCS9_9SPHN|nr:WecB/TagA/CpsF family glycosyltransferase [Sphingomonas sp. BN140010]MCW3796570.1 WecB/TagA/CpsF family glycosyltransferase [Sphingomonas sp. BN140010]